MTVVRTVSTSSRVWQDGEEWLRGDVRVEGFLEEAPKSLMADALEMLEDEADADEAERRYQESGGQGYTRFRDRGAHPD